MEQKGIKRIILEQREEIDQTVENEKIIVRELSIKDAMESTDTIIMMGPRRAGKSFLSILTLIGKTFGYLNFDDERINMTVEDLDLVMETFYEIYGDDLDYIIFDEIQQVQGWEMFVNRSRETIKLVITGSNSSLLSGKFPHQLTVKHQAFTLFPFSFREYLKILGLKISAEETLTTREQAEVKRAFVAFVKEGGFPEVTKQGRAVIRTIYDDIIYKDILLKNKIRKTESFKNLVLLLTSNCSREFTFSKIKNIVHINDVHTVKKFIDLLISAYLFFVVERFSFNIKQQILAPKKIYSIDTGIINAFTYKHSTDNSLLYENIVAIELMRRKHRSTDMEIYYWRNPLGKEVDFVVLQNTHVTQLIQVVSSLNNDYKTKENRIKSLLKCSKELRCNNLLIITDNNSGTEHHKTKTITITPLWKWLLRNE
jgi:predicted AAA+ superfamily ATPase